MSFISMHQVELNLMLKLQSLRCSILDQFMIFCDYLDSTPFYLLMLVCVMYGYNRTLGIRLLYLIVLDAFLIQDLKFLFAQPRPCHLQPILGILTSSSYGFPSGAAQQSLATLCFLALTLRRATCWMFAFSCMLLICFSRVYLGLHFPTDILGGWIFGGISLYCYWNAHPHLERLIARQSKGMNTGIAIIVFSLLYMVSFTTGAEEAIVFGFGASLGFIWSPRVVQPIGLFEKMAQLFAAILGYLLLQFALASFFPSVVLLFIFGIWLSLGIPLCLPMQYEKTSARWGL